MDKAKSIRAITLDVGGTLIEPWPSVGAIYGEVARGFGCPDTEPDRLSMAFGRAWKARQPFDYSRSAWRRLVDQTFEGVSGFAMSDPCFDAIYERFGRAASWRVYDDVGPFIQFARRQDIPVGVVSNWDERLRGLLAGLNLLGAFASVIISHEVGCHKPAPGIFLRAAHQLKLAPEGILHVGDSREEDFEGSRLAGFQSLWLRRNGGTSGGSIQSLAELQGLAIFGSK